MTPLNVSELALKADVSPLTIRREAARIPGSYLHGKRWHFRSGVKLDRWIEYRNPPGDWFTTAEMAKRAKCSNAGICFLASEIPGSRKRGPRDWIFNKALAEVWLGTRREKALRKVNRVSGKGSGIPSLQGHIDGLMRWEKKVGLKGALKWPSDVRRRWLEDTEGLTRIVDLRERVKASLG